jgi:hypothetical protein
MFETVRQTITLGGHGSWTDGPTRVTNMLAMAAIVPETSTSYYKVS